MEIGPQTNKNENWKKKSTNWSIYEIEKNPLELGHVYDSCFYLTT